LSAPALKDPSPDQTAVLPGHRCDVFAHLVGSGNGHRQQDLDNRIELEKEEFGLMKMA
jgi:hypothetical protein